MQTLGHCWLRILWEGGGKWVSWLNLLDNLVKLNMIYKIAMKSDLNCSPGRCITHTLACSYSLRKSGERPRSWGSANENDITWPLICLRKVIRRIWFPSTLKRFLVKRKKKQLEDKSGDNWKSRLREFKALGSFGQDSWLFIWIQ